jgi:hypothetical protein
LLLQAERIQRPHDIVKLAPLIDFNQIPVMQTLDEIYVVLESHGLSEPMGRVVAAARLRSPDDAKFQSRERVLASPHRPLFAATTGTASVSAPPAARPTFRDRLRGVLSRR